MFALVLDASKQQFSEIRIGWSGVDMEKEFRRPIYETQFNATLASSIQIG